MIYFLQSFLFFIFFFEFLDFMLCFSENEDDIIMHNYYIHMFIFFIYINTSFNVLPNKPRVDLDLIYKYCYLFFKTPNFLYNFLLNTIKKIYLYLYHFKYRQNRLTSKILLKKYLNNFFIIWRPLFKKISYFGYFRSNRSKWIK